MTENENTFRSAFDQLRARCDRTDGSDLIGEDGLRRCAVCGKPKEFLCETPPYIRMFGEPVKLPIPCDCVKAAEAERALREEQDEAKARAAARLEECFGASSGKLSTCTFATDDGTDTTNRSILQRYCRKFDSVTDDNIGVMLSGETGSGKTFFAAAVANEILRAGRTVWFTRIADVVALMGGEFNAEKREEVNRRISKTDLLILDDFGVERSSDYMLQKIYEVIDARYAAKLPLIITTNLDKARIHAPQSEAEARIFGRLLEMCPVVLTVMGNRREGIAQEKLQRLREIMNGGESDA